MKKLLLTLLLAIGTASAGRSEIRLPGLLGDHMVLQHAAEVSLWGWARPDSPVTVETSWGAQAATESDREGKWQLRIATPAAGYVPQSIRIADPDGTAELHDVLIGEVWVCAGQSNMFMPLKGLDERQIIAGSTEDIADARHYWGIRMATIPLRQAVEPQDDAAVKWEVCTSESAPEFSAVAYYFARNLSQSLDVPIGILQSSWGGSRIECWMSQEALAPYKEVKLRDMTDPRCIECLRPAVMYNAMIHPLKNYAIRGFVWYQGCANIGQYRDYDRRMESLAADWRRLWQSEELPFYFVEIAPYQYGGSDKAAYLREAQHRAADLIPHSGFVSTSDLVDPDEEDCIHPSRKSEVGERLAALAMNRTYGYADFACEAPTFAAAEFCDDGSVILSFDRTAGGLVTAGELTGFEIAGKNKKFHPARAEILPDGKRIRLRPAAGEKIAAIRYCFRNWAPSAIWNTDGLPLIPFRTDDWSCK